VFASGFSAKGFANATLSDAGQGPGSYIIVDDNFGKAATTWNNLQGQYARYMQPTRLMSEDAAKGFADPTGDVIKSMMMFDGALGQNGTYDISFHVGNSGTAMGKSIAITPVYTRWDGNTRKSDTVSAATLHFLPPTDPPKKDDSPQTHYGADG